MYYIIYYTGRIWNGIKLFIHWSPTHCQTCHLGSRVGDSTWAYELGWSAASGGWCCGSSAAFWRAAGSFEENHEANPWGRSLGILLLSLLWTWGGAEWWVDGSPLVSMAFHHITHLQSSQSSGQSWWMVSYQVVVPFAHSALVTEVLSFICFFLS